MMDPHFVENMLSRVPSERTFQMYILYKKVKDGLSNLITWTGAKVGLVKDPQWASSVIPPNGPRLMKQVR